MIIMNLKMAGVQSAGPQRRMSMDEAKARSRVMKALGHPIRLLIVDTLHQGDRCLCEFHPPFKVRQPTLSRHLAVLKQAGLITEQRAGPRLILHLATPRIVLAFDCAMDVVRADHQRRARSVAPVKP